MRVAQLIVACYEASQYAPVALREGVTEAQLAALADWRESGLFSAKERAVLAYCEAMTREIHFSDAIFSALRSHFDERLIVELTATIAAYNMVSRFLEALQIHISDER